MSDEGTKIQATGWRERTRTQLDAKVSALKFNKHMAVAEVGVCGEGACSQNTQSMNVRVRRFRHRRLSDHNWWGVYGAD